jgi:hypothetical protein
VNHHLACFLIDKNIKQAVHFFITVILKSNTVSLFALCLAVLLNHWSKRLSQATAVKVARTGMLALRKGGPNEEAVTKGSP